MTVQRDLHHHGLTQAQRLRVKPDGIAFNHTGFLHFLNSAPAGRGTQADGLADIVQAGAGIELQNLEDFSV